MRTPYVLLGWALAAVACSTSSGVTSPERDAGSVADAKPRGDARSSSDARANDATSDVVKKADAGQDAGCGGLPPIHCTNGGQLKCTSNGWACVDGCSGPTPLCFGSDLHSCCGQDPAGDAVCLNGAWMCGGAAAPGCNGTSCLHPDGGSSSCTGAPPDCFGNDLTSCCGQDPSGVAMCVNGAWKCGGVDAPGCDGTKCVRPADAGVDARGEDAGGTCGSGDGGSGQAFGNCPGTGKCCAGGAPGTYYCFTGTGMCPPVP